jgi:hypothetical protein
MRARTTQKRRIEFGLIEKNPEKARGMANGRVAVGSDAVGTKRAARAT